MSTQPELKYLCRKSSIKGIFLYLQALRLCLVLVKYFQSACLPQYNYILCSENRIYWVTFGARFELKSQWKGLVTVWLVLTKFTKIPKLLCYLFGGTRSYALSNLPNPFHDAILRRAAFSWAWEWSNDAKTSQSIWQFLRSYQKIPQNNIKWTKRRQA